MYGSNRTIFEDGARKTHIKSESEKGDLTPGSMTDFNTDGITNGVDLGILLSNWTFPQ